AGGERKSCRLALPPVAWRDKENRRAAWFAAAGSGSVAHRTASGAIAGHGEALKEMSPSCFGLVMATGIVSLAAAMMGHPRLGAALFYWNLVQYAALWFLYGLRAWRYPGRFFGDMTSHRTG